MNHLITTVQCFMKHEGGSVIATKRFYLNAGHFELPEERTNILYEQYIDGSTLFQIKMYTQSTTQEWSTVILLMF